MNAAETAFAAQLAARAQEGTGEPRFLRELRGAARDTFLHVKLPTSRHEDWRYTSLSALGEQTFVRASPSRVTSADLPPAPRLVFVNGRLDPEASDVAGLPEGVRAGSLAAALRERPEDVEPHLGKVATTRNQAFGALNLGLFEDGALVELAPGASCEAPIHLVFLSASPLPAATHPRNLILAGAGARATVVETYRGEGAYLVNAVTELRLEEGAELEHDRVQEEGPAAFHVGALEIAQGARSRLTGQSIALGGKLARVEARTLLGAEEAFCDLRGLSVGGGRQVLDHFVRVDHASPRCTSRETFKNILDGSSRGVFAGRIHVREGAQKTDAGQVSSNLLLSEDATVDAKPQLEILADDVKCSHGGAVGQLREDQLFYLRSRGISAAHAKALLTWAFAAEMVDKVGPAEVRARVRAAVRARLPGGELLREVA